MKKIIIAYGDSNTFGYNPSRGGRYDKNFRWTGILAETLADNFQIIEEGCNNRTGFYINNEGFLQTGILYIDECLKKNKTPDIFILALGTNDLQKFYNFDLNIFEQGLNQYIIKLKKQNPNVRIILIPPVKLKQNVKKGSFRFMFNQQSIENSSILQEIYKEFTTQNKIELFDINKFAMPSDIDGLHYSEESHRIIAQNIKQQIINPAYSLNQDSL